MNSDRLSFAKQPDATSTNRPCVRRPSSPKRSIEVSFQQTPIATPCSPRSEHRCSIAWSPQATPSTKVSSHRPHASPSRQHAPGCYRCNPRLRCFPAPKSRSAPRDRRCPLVAMGETPYSPVELAGNFGAGKRFLWRSSPSITRVAHSDCIRVNCSPFSKAARAKKSASSSDQSLESRICS